MRIHIKGIDHVVITARDLDSTQETFTRMGFTLTPRGHHTLGSQNHCVMFGQDYLELLMVPQRLPGREYYYDFARVGDGLAAVALKTDNVRGAYGELTAAAYERLFDVKAKTVAEGLLVDTGDTPIAVVSERALAKKLPGVWISARHQPCMAALFVHVASRDTAERILRAGSLHPARMPDGSVALGAAEAHGVAIIFG